MTIYLFGVSNVGKTTTGRLLAKVLDYIFYDLDEEVKQYFGVTLEEFVNTGTLRERDRKRGEDRRSEGNVWRDQDTLKYWDEKKKEQR